MYGLHLESDVRLPVPPAVGADDFIPSLVFRRAEPGRSAPAPDGPVVARRYCEHGDLIAVRSHGPGGDWIQIPSVGMFHVAPDARRVDVYPESGMNDQILGLVLVGQIAIFVLYQLGYPCLHAAAVTTEHGAVIFLGPKGRGKSTMAAGFVRRGAALLTDDALPLRQEADGVYGAPSLPMMKLWRETAVYALELLEELPDLLADFEKKLLAIDGRFIYAPVPTRVRAIYLLSRYAPDATDRTDINIQPLSQREGFTTLLDHTALRRLVQPVEAVRLMPLYTQLVGQAPVRVLGFPSGFEHQEAVYDRLMADLELA
jgi:hypothetical protein